MCDPVTVTAVAGTALSIAGAVADHQAQNKRSRAVKTEAAKTLATDNRQIALRELQEGIAGRQESGLINAEVTTATGATAADAASRGVGGMTVDLLLKDIERQGAAARGAVEDQVTANTQQLGVERERAQANYQSRINGAPPANPFTTLLRIGGAGVDAASFKIGNKPRGVN